MADIFDEYVWPATVCIVKILFEVKIVTTYNIYLTLDKSEILFIRDSAKKKENQNSNNQQQT